MIKLDDQYHITGDKYNWRLHFKGEPYTKNFKGELKTVTPTDKWFYPNLHMCLNKYLNESTKPSKSVEELFDKLIEIEGKIQSIC